MKKTDIIRAWKDEEYRNSLSETQRKSLPGNPAGLIEMTDEALEEIAGGGSCLCCSCDANIVDTKI